MIERLEEGLAALDGAAGSSDDVMSEKARVVREKIAERFKSGKIVDVAREIVDASGVIHFYDERARKFIDRDLPTFKLRIPVCEKSMTLAGGRKMERLLETGRLKVGGDGKMETPFDLTRPGDVEALRVLTEFKTAVLQAEFIDPIVSWMVAELAEIEGEDSEIGVMIRELLGETPRDAKKVRKLILPSFFRVLVENSHADLVMVSYFG